MILLRLSGVNPVAVQKAAERVGEFLARSLSSLSSASPSDYELLGPAPASILRVARRYRWQILLKVPLQAETNRVDWEAVRSHCGSTVSLAIDIDPMNLM